MPIHFALQACLSLEPKPVYRDDAYIEGWCSVMGPNHGKETDDTDFDCKAPDEQNDFDLGYTAGFRSTCKEMGLTTGPDSGCEGSIDVVLP